MLGSGAELAKQQRELEQFKGALVSARSSEGAQSMVAQVRLQNLDEREQGLSVQMRAHPYACKCSVCTVRRRPPATAARIAAKSLRFPPKLGPSVSTERQAAPPFS